MSDLRVKRAYRAARRSDGQRVLVDRIWPRGLAKDRLRLDAWAKELAPSTDLRAWFGHDPNKWDEFRRRYGRELDGKPQEVEALRQRLRDGPVTLVYGAKDEEHNNAVALKEAGARGMNLEHLGSRLIQDMPDALIVADADGIIRLWNAGAERIFGFASADAIGRSLDLITPENLRARHWIGYRRTIQTGETKYGSGDLLSVPAIRKDGRRISVQFSIMPLKSEDGGLDGIAAIMRDVTADFEERKRLKQELSRAAR